MSPKKSFSRYDFLFAVRLISGILFIASSLTVCIINWVIMYHDLGTFIGVAFYPHPTMIMPGLLAVVSLIVWFVAPEE